MPSGDVAAAVPLETATKVLFPKVTEDQVELDGKVLAVHVLPSELEAAAVPPPFCTTTKIPFPKVTETQLELDGKVLAVHVMPSGLVAADVLDCATATKTPLP